MRIRIITPITTKDFAKLDPFLDLVSAETDLDMVQIETGPASIESYFDEMLAVPGTVACAIEAERDGVDAVVINCMGDPGMHPAREAVAIPVIGPCEATMHLAAMLGHTFSVLTVMCRLRPHFENQAKVYGVREKLASVRAVEIPVLELERDWDAMIRSLTDEAERAVLDDGASVVMFGCTGMAGAAEAVQAGLEARGLDGVPVIDSMAAAIKVAEAVVGSGLTHSKRAYPYPPAKPVVGYAMPEIGLAGAVAD